MRQQQQPSRPGFHTCMLCAAPALQLKFMAISVIFGREIYAHIIVSPGSLLIVLLNLHNSLTKGWCFNFEKKRLRAYVFTSAHHATPFNLKISSHTLISRVFHCTLALFFSLTFQGYCDSVCLFYLRPMKLGSIGSTG